MPGSIQGPSQPALTVADGRVVDSQGTNPGPNALVTLATGARLCPGFVDHHLHLLAMAAARCSIDLSRARRVTEVFDQLRAGVAAAAAGGWVRAWGIDESDLAEGRLPTVAELDAICPDRALVVHHRTGHAQLLNTAALVRGGTAPPLAETLLVAALRQLSAELSAAGVVAVTDATHTNDRAALALLDRLLERAGFAPRVTAMVGADRLDGCRFGDQVGRVMVGHAKIMPPSCGLDGVASLVAHAHRRGFPVAVHAVDVDELQAALDAGIGLGGRGGGDVGGSDRVEHLGLCLPEQLDALAGRRLSVVTQPTFVTRRARKYRQELSPVELGWLYRLASLQRAGVTVRSCSDAPVVPIGPLEQVRAAATRTLGEFPGRPSERIDVDSAMRLVTSPPLQVGDPADFVVLSGDPTVLGPDRLAEVDVWATVQGGMVVHGSLTARPEEH
ncbi:MAG: amidohydrolase family protein [Acidimicrobiales bacterium]